MYKSQSADYFVSLFSLTRYHDQIEKTLAMAHAFLATCFSFT